MAILDRPLFQRRPTKDELRQYGIPAFANGGIVYMNQGGVPGLQNRNTTPPPTKPDISLTPIGTVISKEIIERDGKKIEVTETVVPGARGQKIIQKSEKVLFTPGSTTTVRGQEITTPAQGEDVEVGKVEIDEEEEKETAPPPAEDAPTVEPPTSTTDDPSAPKERERLMNLEELVKERSELYKKIIGDPREALKQQGFLQLSQFGLNLAAARGGNLAEKIARSAADPLQSFAALAQQAMKDERAIDLLAIEAGEEELARAKEDDKAGSLGQIAEAFKIAEPGKSQAYYMNKAIDFAKAKSGQSDAEITASLAETVYKAKSANDPDYSLSDAFAEVGTTFGTNIATKQGGGSVWDSIEIGGVFVGDDGKQYRKTGSAYTAENIELIG